MNGILNGSVQVSWNGNVLATESVGSGWTNLQFVVMATGTNTSLQFTFAGIFFHATTTTALDGVSVVPLGNNYNQIAAQLVGASNVRLAFAGNPTANYALDRTFNLSSPINWVPQLTNVTDETEASRSLTRWFPPPTISGASVPCRSGGVRPGNLDLMKTKRNLIQICLLGVLFLPIVVQAQFTYTTNSDNTINITGYTGDITVYTGPSGALTFPPTLAGLPITSLGEGAFEISLT